MSSGFYACAVAETARIDRNTFSMNSMVEWASLQSKREMNGFFIWLGIYALTYFLYENLRSPLILLYYKWHNPRKSPVKLTEKYGKWAAVTGSTDGIGKAYAQELAGLGFNIVLISRTESKLKDVAQQIEKEFRVETYIVQADFTEGFDIYNELIHQLSNKAIGILVNNVGIGHNPPGAVDTFSAEHLWHMINVNIVAATLLSRHFIDKWHKAGERGHIVNISSGLELQPCPYGAVYGASKAYMRSFTLALQQETKRLGISVQLVSPNFVVTKINSFSSKVMRGNLFIPQPGEYAKWAVNTLDKVDETSGYIWHGIQNTIWKIIPWRLRTNLLMIVSKLIVDNLVQVKKKVNLYTKE